MIKKLTNIVQHYDQYLMYMSEMLIRSLTHKEKLHLEAIESEGLLSFWSDVYMKQVLDSVLYDVIITPTILEYFDYTPEEILGITEIFHQKSDKSVYEFLIVQLVKDNEEALSNFLTIESSGNVSLSNPNPSAQLHINKIIPIPHKYDVGYVEFTPRDWEILKAKGVMMDTEKDEANDWVGTFPPGYWGQKYSKKMYSNTLQRLRHTDFSEFYSGGVID